MSIYNIAVLCLITAPVAMVIVSIFNMIFRVRFYPLSLYLLAGLATGCIVRFCISRRNLLLFSQHAVDICAKSKYTLSNGRQYNFFLSPLGSSLVSSDNWKTCHMTGELFFCSAQEKLKNEINHALREK